MAAGLAPPEEEDAERGQREDEEAERKEEEGDGRVHELLLVTSTGDERIMPAGFRGRIRTTTRSD